MLSFGKVVVDVLVIGPFCWRMNEGSLVSVTEKTLCPMPSRDDGQVVGDNGIDVKVFLQEAGQAACICLDLSPGRFVEEHL